MTEYVKALSIQGEDESSNRYYDFVQAKELFRQF